MFTTYQGRFIPAFLRIHEKVQVKEQDSGGREQSSCITELSRTADHRQLNRELLVSRRG